MDIAVSVISLLLVLVLIARGVPGRNLLVALAMALAVVVLVIFAPKQPEDHSHEIADPTRPS